MWVSVGNDPSGGVCLSRELCHSEWIMGMVMGRCYIRALDNVGADEYVTPK